MAAKCNLEIMVPCMELLLVTATRREKFVSQNFSFDRNLTAGVVLYGVLDRLPLPVPT